MSEYQYVHFMALDRALDEKQLAYMRTQSSRAEITKWEFTNEYNFGDFHGDAMEMMRRGYDIHLHFANYGIRRLLFRLPAGLPCDQKTWEAYLPEYGLTWNPDKKGRGGILEIYPESDAGTFDYFMDIDVLLKKVAPIRELLIAGDLRPLYVMWLALTAINGDDEAAEPPLPAGMDSLPECVLALAEFYELDVDLMAAASEESPPIPKANKTGSLVTSWLERQSEEDLLKLAQRLLEEDYVGSRLETLALIRNESEMATWPSVNLRRTFEQLYERAKIVESHRLEKEADRKQKARHAKLKKLAADPKAVLADVEKLVKQHGSSNYVKAVQTLVDLGEALGPEGPALMQEEARRLSKAYPTLRGFISELREHGFLKKTK